jgi:hypothetical protein
MRFKLRHGSTLDFVKEPGDAQKRPSNKAAKGEIRSLAFAVSQEFGRARTPLETVFSVTLFAQAHDDECNDQPIQRDGLDQRESDPHVFADTPSASG